MLATLIAAALVASQRSPTHQIPARDAPKLPEILKHRPGIYGKLKEAELVRIIQGAKANVTRTLASKVELSASHFTEPGVASLYVVGYVMYSPHDNDLTIWGMEDMSNGFIPNHPDGVLGLDLDPSLLKSKLLIVFNGHGKANDSCWVGGSSLGYQQYSFGGSFSVPIIWVAKSDFDTRLGITPSDHAEIDIGSVDIYTLDN